ncbi:MAG: response regulator [Proteobacteria bacterium]|nr:MAG: response regulator [Pseudomonadota bacterium]
MQNLSPVKKLILIVEDSQAQSYALARTLRNAGYHAFECATLASARDALRTKPDICIVDVMMPDGNGVDFCKELKSDPATASIHTILYSAVRDAVTEHLSLMTSGAQAFLSKPFENAELLEAIQTILGTTKFKS